MHWIGLWRLKVSVMLCASQPVTCKVTFLRKLEAKTRKSLLKPASQKRLTSLELRVELWKPLSKCLRKLHRLDTPIGEYFSFAKHVILDLSHKSPKFRMFATNFQLGIGWFWLLGWLIHKGATCTRIAPLWIYTFEWDRLVIDLKVLGEKTKSL